MRIFVGGLPYSTSSDELRDLFAQTGNVTEANVVQDRYTSESKGFGFVEMPEAAEAQAAISKLNGYSLGGRPLTVNEAKPREDRGSRNGSSSSGGSRNGYSYSGSGGGGGRGW